MHVGTLQLRVEAVAKVTRINTLSPGDKVWFSSTVRVNEDEIYVTQLALVVVADSEFNNTAYNEVGLRFLPE